MIPACSFCPLIAKYWIWCWETKISSRQSTIYQNGVLMAKIVRALPVAGIEMVIMKYYDCQCFIGHCFIRMSLGRFIWCCQWWRWKILNHETIYGAYDKYLRIDASTIIYQDCLDEDLLLAASKGYQTYSQQSDLATCVRGQFEQWIIASINCGRSSVAYIIPGPVNGPRKRI